jgi:hypothetical protein
MQEVSVGREGGVGAQQMHGGLGHGLQTDGAWRSWDHRSQASRLRTTNAMVMVREDRQFPCLQ